MRTGKEYIEAAGIRFELAGRTIGAQPGQEAAPQGWFLERLLRRAIRVERGSTALRRLIGRSRLKPANIHLMSDEEVLRVLARLVSVGEVQVTQTRWCSHGSSRGAAGDGRTQAATTGGKAITSTSGNGSEFRGEPMSSAVTPIDRPFPPSTNPEPRNWIEFQLVDHETDEPIANVPFRIALPDGAVAEHTSDGNGMIRIDDLPPGYCDIREILDRGAFEVVGIA